MQSKPIRALSSGRTENMFYTTAETMSPPPLPPTFDLNTLHLQSRAITPVPSNVSTTSEEYYYPSSCSSVGSTSCFAPPHFYRPPHNANQYRSYVDVRSHHPQQHQHPHPHYSLEYAPTLHSMAEIQPAPIETIPAKAEDSDDPMDMQSGTIEMDQAEIDAIIRNKRKVRDPKACYACHRRKVKCDRGLPCDSCVKRDHPELCSYERPTKKRRIALTAAATIRPENRDISSETLSSSGPNITVPKEQWEKINRELSQLRAQTHIKEEKEELASPLQDVQITSGIPSEEGDREGVHAPSNQMGTMHLGSRSVLAYMIGNRSKSAQDAASSLLEDNILPNLGLDNETTTYPFVDLWSTDSSMQDVSGLVEALPEDGLCREFWLTYRDIPCTIYPVVPDTGAFDQTLTYLLNNRAELMRTGGDIDPDRPYGVSLPWLALLFAVLASGSQSTGRPAKERELTSQVYICCSYQALRMSNFLTHPSLETIEALLIIGNALSYNMNPGVSYILLGMTLRSALSMGLHVQSQTFSEHEQYLRSRIWWALAWQDSHFSVSYDRPSSSILCTPDLPFTKHSKAGSRSYVESMCAIIRLTQEILRERSINSRSSMNWALITKYKDEVHRIWDEAMPRLRDRQQCVSMTDHLERLALRIHCSYMISEICRPVLKEDAMSSMKSPVVSPGVGTGMNPRRKSSLSASSPVSMTAGECHNTSQTLAYLRAECIHYLEEVVDTYVELRSINKFAARSWVGIQRSISAAFLLGTLPETRAEPRIIKLLTDLEQGIELSAREDDIFVGNDSTTEPANASPSPAWVKNMTKSLGALSNLNAALAAGRAGSNANMQGPVSGAYQQYSSGKPGSNAMYNTPAASPTNGVASVPGSIQAPTSAGGHVGQQNKMAMSHSQQGQQARQQPPPPPPPPPPRHASYPLVYQHNQMGSHQQHPGQHHNQYAQQPMQDAMQMPMNTNQSFGPYTPDSMNGRSSLDGGAWHYGNIQERAMEYVHPGLWG